MSKLNDRITSVSCLKNELNTGLVCLTDVNSSEIAEHVFITSNLEFVEFNFGEPAIASIQDLLESCDSHEIVVFNLLAGKAQKMVPTLYTGYAQKAASLEPFIEENALKGSLNFSADNFVDKKGNKARLIHTLEDQEFGYVFSINRKKEEKIRQVNAFGFSTKGKALIFNNEQPKPDIYEVEGYVVLQSDFEPIFLSKGCKSPNLPTKSLVLPCIAYRTDSGQLLRLVILANKINGGL